MGKLSRGLKERSMGKEQEVIVESNVEQKMIKKKVSEMTTCDDNYSVCRDCKHCKKQIKTIIHRPTSSSLMHLDKVGYACTLKKFGKKEEIVKTLTKKSCVFKEKR